MANRVIIISNKSLHVSTRNCGETDTVDLHLLNTYTAYHKHSLVMHTTLFGDLKIYRSRILL